MPITILTRWTRDLDMAKQLGENALGTACSACGSDSDQAICAAVKLSGVQTELGEHGRALSLRMGVFGSFLSDVVNTCTDKPVNGTLLLVNDTISMNAFGGIADYSIRFGYAKDAIIWWSRAKMAAQQGWENTVETG